MKFSHQICEWKQETEKWRSCNKKTGRENEIHLNVKPKLNCENYNYRTKWQCYKSWKLNIILHWVKNGSKEMGGWRKSTHFLTFHSRNQSIGYKIET